MGICTNKRQFVTEKLIQEMNLSKFFITIVGARDNIPLKPKPNMLILTMEVLTQQTKCFTWLVIHQMILMQLKLQI